jgi:hypothetical protein
MPRQLRIEYLGATSVINHMTGASRFSGMISAIVVQ